jgi:hypothetical protein
LGCCPFIGVRNKRIENARKIARLARVCQRIEAISIEGLKAEFRLETKEHIAPYRVLVSSK